AGAARARGDGAAEGATVGVVLETVAVSRSFGAVKAADNLSLRFAEGQVVGIVGPNGSGKTTFVNIVTGYVKPTHGRILFRDRDITRLRPREVTNLGIARSFQIPSSTLTSPFSRTCSSRCPCRSGGTGSSGARCAWTVASRRRCASWTSSGSRTAPTS